ncbi:hypothetical protein GCM10017673_38610 [Streptosporangium violaceochromogenes]|nr:hypothetical protein GCM10017673_38610 [Streptosporangium violaceochromogenes]
MNHRQPGQEPGTRALIAAYRAGVLAVTAVLVWAAATTTVTPLRFATCLAAAFVVLAEVTRSALHPPEKNR